MHVDRKVGLWKETKVAGGGHVTYVLLHDNRACGVCGVCGVWEWKSVVKKKLTTKKKDSKVEKTNARKMNPRSEARAGGTFAARAFGPISTGPRP